MNSNITKLSINKQTNNGIAQNTVQLAIELYIEKKMCGILNVNSIFTEGVSNYGMTYAEANAIFQKANQLMFDSEAIRYSYNIKMKRWYRKAK